MSRTRRPGEVRDAIVAVLGATPDGVSLPDIERRVIQRIGKTPASSVRSYLRLNTPQLFSRRARGLYALKENPLAFPYVEPVSSKAIAEFQHGKATLYRADCMEWLRVQPANSIHAVVTDPPYGLFEYSPEQQEKLRAGRGGVWRIPPSFDGTTRAPLPRFTVLSKSDLEALDEFFFAWASTLSRVIVPGANVIVASNPLLSYVVSGALARAGLERRGELVRLVMTMRAATGQKRHTRSLQTLASCLAPCGSLGWCSGSHWKGAHKTTCVAGRPADLDGPQLRSRSVTLSRQRPLTNPNGHSLPIQA